nr:hypothetical protein LKV13_04465 [Borrelia sp. BU AG58]
MIAEDLIKVGVSRDVVKIMASRHHCCEITRHDLELIKMEIKNDNEFTRGELKSDIKMTGMELKGTLKLHNWMISFLLALNVAILLAVFFK